MSNDSSMPPIPPLPPVPPAMPPLPPSGSTPPSYSASDFPEGPHGFSNVVKTHFSTVFKMNFNGRASQGEYWWTYLAYGIAGFILNIILPKGSALSGIWALYSGIIFLMLGVRRLHDSNRSGAWILLGVGGAISFIIGLVLFFGATFSGLFGGSNGATVASGLAGVGILFFVIGFGLLIANLVLFIIPGTQGPNRYGNLR